MKALDFAGLVGGLVGAALFAGALLLAAASALRVLAVRRRPGKGRVARGVLAGAGVLAAGGLALFWASELAPFRRLVDRKAAWLAALAGAVALAVALRVALRRSPPPGGDGSPAAPPGP